jgi:O-antigen/teichoic acid export membrane protein
LSLAWAYAIGSLVGFFIILIALRSHLAHLLTRIDWQLAKYIINRAWPFAFGSLVASILAYTDTLMLGWLKPIEEVGLYNAALKIPQLLYIPGGLIATTIFPILSRTITKREKFKKASQKSIELLLYLGIPLVIGGIILASPIINLLYGQEFTSAYTILQILMPFVFFAYVNGIVFSALFAQDLQKRMFAFFTIGAGANIILNLLLIPLYGPDGAATASITAQLINFILMARLFRSANGYFPFTFQEIKKPLLAGAIMGAALFIPPIHQTAMWISIPLVSIVYFVMLYFFKAPLFRQVLSLIK